MAIHYRKNCKICMAMRGNPKLRARIRYAAFRRQDGDETLQDISKDLGLNTSSMYNHVKKHMVDTSDQEEARREIRVAKKKEELHAKVQKETELQLSKQTVDEIEARPAEIIGLDEYIAQGIEDIRKGNMRMTPNSFLAAVKIKTDWSSKQQNNKIEIMRTMMAFASGRPNKKGKQEDSHDSDTTSSTESLSGGEEESGRIYRAAFGDATPPGPETLPPEDFSQEA